MRRLSVATLEVPNRNKMAVGSRDLVVKSQQHDRGSRFPFLSSLRTLGMNSIKTPRWFGNRIMRMEKFCSCFTLRRMVAFVLCTSPFNTVLKARGRHPGEPFDSSLFGHNGLRIDALHCWPCREGINRDGRLSTKVKTRFDSAQPGLPFN